MVCKQCGWDNEPGARGCAGCGAELAADSAGRPGPPPPPAPAPRAAASARRGSAAKWYVLGGVVVGLAVAGLLVGRLVVYPAREAAKIRGAYGEIARVVSTGDLEALLPYTSGEARSDVAELVPAARMLQHLQIGCSVNVKDVQVKGKAATAQVDVTLDLSGTFSLSGFSAPQTEHLQASETHQLTREEGGWKVSSWGDNGGIHVLAGKVGRLRGVLGL